MNISNSRATFRKWLFLCLCSQPLLILVVRGWSSAILIVGGLLCLGYLVMQRVHNVQQPASDAHALRWARWLSWAFASWALVTLFAGLLRGHLDWPLMDSPSRFLLAIPVIYFAMQAGSQGLRTLVLAMCLGLFATLAHQLFFPHDQDWSAERMSNYFVDPLAFGYISLSLAFVAIGSAVAAKTQTRWLLGLKVLAAMVGMYMSIMTASRTGWFALPLVLLLIAYFQERKFNWRSIATAISVLAGVLLAGYAMFPTVQDRSHSTIDDITGYSFQGIAPETSVGLRVTFLRIAADMLQHQPLAGYGDTQKNPPTLPPAVQQYASSYAQGFALASGFHNEMVTNGIQSGVLAMLATMAIFGVPLTIYMRALQSQDDNKRQVGLLGLVFGLTIFISSLSTEVFGLKYTASYYALMTALFCGACLQPAAKKTS